MVFLSHRAIATRVTEDALSNENFPAPGMEATPVRPPIFYANEFGVVTNRRQFLKFYHHELMSGLPIGPHIFARR